MASSNTEWCETMRSLKLLVISCAVLSVFATTCSAALAETIKDEQGNIFMEETTQPQPKPRSAPRNLNLDLQNVGVQVDENGRIIPLINQGAPPVQVQESRTDAYSEVYVPTPYGSVPIYGPGFPPYGPMFGPVYGAPIGGYPVGGPVGGNIGLGIGGRNFGLGINLGLPGLGYPGYGYGYPGYGSGYGQPAVPFSVAPFGFATPMPYMPVIYGNGTMSMSGTTETSTGLGIGPNLFSAKTATNTFSTPLSSGGSQYISTPWMDSASNFGSNTWILPAPASRSLLAPLLDKMRD